MVNNSKQPALQQTDHRPWPLPPKRPLLKQVWQNLAFMHWPVSYEQIRAAIPQPLEIDTFNGEAWIAVVPFDMKGVTLTGCPSVPWLSDFPEINVRTYVKYQGKAGVWFFSLDVPSRFAVWAARKFFHLPYRWANVEVTMDDATIHYQHSMASAAFKARYKPTEPVTYAKETFEIWATERYCLYCASKSGTLYRTEVQHPQWPLQKADIDIETNTLIDSWNIGARHPSVLFAQNLDVVAYAPQSVHYGR